MVLYIRILNVQKLTISASDRETDNQFGTVISSCQASDSVDSTQALIDDFSVKDVNYAAVEGVVGVTTRALLEASGIRRDVIPLTQILDIEIILLI